MRKDADNSHPPAPLGAVLAVTFLGSISGGAFWAGLFFVTAGHYHFSPERNLVLAALMGLVYAVAAGGSGAAFRRIAPRRVLVGSLGTWAIAALLPVLFPGHEVALWVIALVGSAGSAVTFPIVESYLTAGRHGARMRSAIGWFNVTWTPATAIPLLVMPIVARASPTWAIGMSAIVNAVALVFVAALPSRPGAHEKEAATAAVGPEYRWLVRSASWLVPLSYVMYSTIGPLLPHRLASVGITSSSASLVAALWMAARFVTLFVMWRAGFWHGRWGTLVAAGATLAVGLGLVLLAPTAAGVVIGLVVFGTGMGLTYYAAFYYSMAVGHAAVEAGGGFEALIGVGYTVGPVIGLLGYGVASPAASGSATVAFTLLAVLVASPGVIRPYFQARRARHRRG